MHLTHPPWGEQWAATGGAQGASAECLAQGHTRGVARDLILQTLPIELPSRLLLIAHFMNCKQKQSIILMHFLYLLVAVKNHGVIFLIIITKIVTVIAIIIIII